MEGSGKEKEEENKRASKYNKKLKTDKSFDEILKLASQPSEKKDKKNNENSV